MIDRSRGSPSESPGRALASLAHPIPHRSAYPVEIRGPSRLSKHILGSCRLYLTSEMVSGGSCRARESQEGERQAMPARGGPGPDGRGRLSLPTHLQARTYSQDSPTCRARGEGMSPLRSLESQMCPGDCTLESTSHQACCWHFCGTAPLSKAPAPEQGPSGQVGHLPSLAPDCFPRVPRVISMLRGKND